MAASGHTYARTAHGHASDGQRLGSLGRAGVNERAHDLRQAGAAWAGMALPATGYCFLSRQPEWRASYHDGFVNLDAELPSTRLCAILIARTRCYASHLPSDLIGQLARDMSGLTAL